MKIPTQPSSVPKDYKKEAAKKSNDTSAVDQQRSAFLEILESVLPSTSERTKELHDLWKELPDLERNLIEKASSENLEAYKNLIQSIVSQTLRKYTKVTELHSKKWGHDIKDVIVRTIDENLKLLTQTILSKENTAFRILTRLDSIRGLLIDLKK